jgi:outer membrane cobalamin receptor
MKRAQLILALLLGIPPLSHGETARAESERWAQQPLIMLKNQGTAQSTLSIRGATPTCSYLSINGHPLKDAWSGLYNTELPFSSRWLAFPATRALTAPASAHLETTRLDETISLYAGAGSPKRILGGGEATLQLTDSTSISPFFKGLSDQNTDRLDNDLNQYSGGVALQSREDDDQTELLIAHQEKEYGTRGFDGLPSGIHAESRRVDSMALFSKLHGDPQESFWRISADARQVEQTDQLPSLGFRHRARTRSAGLVAAGQTIEIQQLSLYAQAAVAHEQLDADVQTDRRTRANLLLLPQYTRDRFTCSAGLDSTFYSNHSADWLPRASINFFLNDNSILFADYRETSSQPSFRDLYYNDPYRTGKTNLKPIHTRKAEIGFRQFISASIDWHAALFYRHQKNSSDWTRQTAADPLWSVTDLGSLDAIGFETALNMRPSDTLTLNLFYQWMDQEDAPVYAGLYTLDYAQHLFNLTLLWSMTSELQLIYRQGLRYQAENNHRSSSRFGPDGSIALTYSPRVAPRTTLSMALSNLWNSDFQQVPGAPAARTAFTTTLQVSW